MKTPEQQKGCPYCGTLVKDLICDKPPIMSQQIFENRERLVSDYVKASAAELVEKAREWIPVGERLPEINSDGTSNKVQVYVVDPDYDRKFISIMFRMKCEVEDAWYSVFGNAYYPVEYETVTHWMPLPEPPKVEAEVGK